LYGMRGGVLPAATAAAPKTSGANADTGWRALADRLAFGASRPFGLALVLHDFWHERRYLAELAAHSARFTFGARREAAAAPAQVMVLVIGESSRHDRWSLNGYPRDTTPLLRRQPNLVSLSDLITPVSATRLSVPLMLSRKPAMQSLQADFAEKSALSAYREAGFKTWWLSNQMSFGKFDTPVSVYANEADVVRFLNRGDARDSTSHDEVLLPALARALADPAPHKLIVLHTLGSHWNYSRRYPASYGRWQPSLSGIAQPAVTDPALKTALNNSYDNTILYTDWLLAQVIGQLAATRLPAAMIYVSDHGQTLYDGSCKLAFHGHNTQYEFHVPALVWHSDAWGAAYPAKLEQLRRHRDAPLSTENVFHSLLDAAAIRYPDERLEWSIFSAQWRPHRRYVDSYGWADYDHARLRGDCREVIDRGTPLARRR
ncbi:MAG: phosphoethanolamine transferase, partial [Burkholderiaceae bacterium]